jgi:hypothetical protein
MGSNRHFAWQQSLGPNVRLAQETLSRSGGRSAAVVPRELAKVCEEVANDMMTVA